MRISCSRSGYRRSSAADGETAGQDSRQGRLDQILGATIVASHAGDDRRIT